MSFEEFYVKNAAEGEDFSLGTKTPETSENASSTPLWPLRGCSIWERSDSYRGFLFEVSDGWRVVVCRDGLQWILQQREARDHWEGRKYFARKSHLAEAIKKMFGDDEFARVKARVEALPI